MDSITTPPFLQLRQLRKSIAGKRLLDIDDFAVSKGTCIILSGSNGAGKSTLLKIIAGLEVPDHVDGKGSRFPGMRPVTTCVTRWSTCTSSHICSTAVSPGTSPTA